MKYRIETFLELEDIGSDFTVECDQIVIADGLVVFLSQGAVNLSIAASNISMMMAHQESAEVDGTDNRDTTIPNIKPIYDNDTFEMPSSIYGGSGVTNGIPGGWHITQYISQDLINNSSNKGSE